MSSLVVSYNDEPIATKLKRSKQSWARYERPFSKFSLLLWEQAFRPTVFLWAATRGFNMRKLSLALAALATIAVAAPTIASAEDFGVRIGGDHHRDRGEFRDHREFRGARAEYRDHDRGFRGSDRDHGGRMIIRRNHYERD
jgi:hypothetical protein